MSELLINNQANVNIQNKKGYSALSLSILNNFNDIAMLLLKNGANANETNSISINARALAKMTSNKPIADSLKKGWSKTKLFSRF
ncbi:MAG: ankyrin repeat domain-containing protein [Bacteroidetes bacterium]|nr:ankyrin repeat domain-containing protein [Bacteroidota bacterium]